jgi:cytidylate kinase
MVRLGHIAIDGPAGSGKTTVARALAGRLHLLYLDTGSMYRAVAALALAHGCDPADAAGVLALVRANPVRAVHDRTSADGFRIFAGDRELGDDLYGPGVSRIVSIVAAQPAIRELMVDLQRAVATQSSVVMAGRDIGTVVLPDAALKIFLTASLAARVDRRLAELSAAGIAIDHATLEREMRERDRLDENRAIAPLRPAADAVVIDSTGIAVDAVVERIASLVEARP